MDRYVKEKGTNPFELNPLRRLALVGTSGLGALIYRPEITASKSVDRLLDLDQLRKKVIDIYDDYSFDDIEEIFKLGASLGGARPKVNL